MCNGQSHKISSPRTLFDNAEVSQLRLAQTKYHAMQPLMEAGLDSIGAMELCDILGQRFGITLPRDIHFRPSYPPCICNILVNNPPTIWNSRRRQWQFQYGTQQDFWLCFPASVIRFGTRCTTRRWCCAYRWHLLSLSNPFRWKQTYNKVSCNQCLPICF